MQYENTNNIPNTTWHSRAEYSRTILNISPDIIMNIFFPAHEKRQIETAKLVFVTHRREQRFHLHRIMSLLSRKKKPKHITITHCRAKKPNTRSFYVVFFRPAHSSGLCAKISIRPFPVFRFFGSDITYGPTFAGIRRIGRWWEDAAS